MFRIEGFSELSMERTFSASKRGVGEVWLD